LSGFHARFAAGVVRRPRRVLLAAGAAAAAAAALLWRFQVDPDVEHLFPKDDPTLRLTRHLQGDSPPSRVLFVVLRGEDARAVDEAVPAVARGLRTSPFLARVVATREEFAGPRFEWHRRAPLYGLPEETLDRLRARLAGPERRAELESAARRLADDPLAGKQTLLRDPLGVRWIFDEAAQAPGRFPFRLLPGSPYLVTESPPLAFLRAVGRDDSFKTSFSEALLRDVRARLEAALAGTAVRAELAGGYVSAEFHAGAMRKDMQVQIVSSLVLVMAFLSWSTRSGLAPHALLLPVALAIACSLAFGGWLLGPLTPLAVSAAAILIAQGIDFPVHFFSRFRAERTRLGRAEAVAASQASLGRPFLGAAATTLAAFAALLASHFPGFRQLGVLLFLGLSLALVASMTLLPVLLLGLDRFLKPAAPRVPAAVRAAARPRPAAAAGMAALALAAWTVVGLRGVRVDLDLRNSMPPGDPGLAVLQGLERDLGVSLTPVFALTDAGVDPESLAPRLAALRASGRIGGADGPHALFPSAADRARARRFLAETGGWVEGTIADLAALGFRPDSFRPGLEELQRALAAPAPEVATLDREEFSALRRASVYERDGKRFWVVTLLPARSLWTPSDRAAFDGAARAELGGGTEFYSAFHLPDHYAAVLLHDLRGLALWTAAGVAVLTLLSAGQVRGGLLALVPVAAAAGVALAAAALFGYALNPMNLASIPIVLGIGVDAGIHYVCRLRGAGRADPGAAVLEAGPGIWGSAVTTLLGFGSIAFSSTPGLASMGVLVAVGVVTSLAAALYLLPALSRVVK
jgi:hypothetical protein